MSYPVWGEGVGYIHISIFIVLMWQLLYHLDHWAFWVHWDFWAHTHTHIYIYIGSAINRWKNDSCQVPLALHLRYSKLRTKHAGHCWRSRDELISDVLLWTPTYSRAKAGQPAQTYIQQLCEDTGCSPEDLPEAMNDREKWRERVRDIRARGTTRWWWWYIYINASFAIY